jgi:flagellar basal body-associated protein FliL
MVMTDDALTGAGNGPGDAKADKKAAKAAAKAAKKAGKGKDVTEGEAPAKKKSYTKWIVIAVVFGLFRFGLLGQVLGPVMQGVKLVLLPSSAPAKPCPTGQAWVDKYIGLPDPAPAAAPAPGVTTTTAAPDPCAPVAGPTYNTADAVTLNLADGRYAKFRLAFLLTTKGNADAMGKDDQGAKGKQAAINLLSAKTYEDLQPPKLLETERELSKAVALAYDGEVMNAYFIDLVKQ